MRLDKTEQGGCKVDRGKPVLHAGDRARGLLTAWWRDESGQMGIGYAVASMTGVFTAYQTTGYIGEQIADIFGQVSQALDMVNKGLR